MPEPTALIRIERLCKQYETAAGPFPVLKEINLTVQTGEFAAVMGPSGSGKSTFMNIVGCLDRQTSGDYWLDGEDVRGLDVNQRADLRKRVIGFVFQGFNLLPRMNLTDNVALPLVYAGVPRHERERRAAEVLGRVGLGAYLKSHSNTISGGQQQRVAIARALVNQPRLILADEPTGNLDSRTSEEIMALFRELNGGGITILLVTHEPDIAAHARRLVRFLDGRIVHDGPVTHQEPP